MQPNEGHRGGRRAEHGAALAEFAVVVPIMLMMLLVVYDFGRGFMDYVSVSNGARDGARVGATIDHSTEQSLCEVNEAAVRSAARSGAEPLGIPDTAAAIPVVYDPVSGRCTVTVNHTYRPVLPFVTSSFTLPVVGTIGPLWDGTMSETMVSQ